MRKTLAFVSLLLANTLAFAGQQYIDESGFAASGYDVVAFRTLQQSAIGSTQPEAVPGSAKITADYNGATWAFASDENRKTFLSDPAKYAPIYDGHCAYGVAQGGKVPGNPNLWRIVDDKLYFNITPQVAGLWESDIPGQIDEADSKWIKAEKKRASRKSWKKIKDNKGTYSKAAPI